MRIDKYLKVTRLVKRRTIANKLCDVGQVLLNGKTAKAANEIKPGDTITLQFGTHFIQVEIIGLPNRALATQAEALQYYRVITDNRAPKPTSPEPLNLEELLDSEPEPL